MKKTLFTIVAIAAFNKYLRNRRPQILIHGHQHVRVQTRVELHLSSGTTAHSFSNCPAEN